MTPGHRPLLPGETFRIRPTGKEHTVGEIDCPACGVVNGIRYPHPHRQGDTIIHLQFLVHGEAFQDAFAQYCEGGCFVPPIKFAPKPNR
jgi:hypothetical protein